MGTSASPCLAEERSGEYGMTPLMHAAAKGQSKAGAYTR